MCSEQVLQVDKSVDIMRREYDIKVPLLLTRCPGRHSQGECCAEMWNIDLEFFLAEKQTNYKCKFLFMLKVSIQTDFICATHIW